MSPSVALRLHHASLINYDSTVPDSISPFLGSSPLPSPPLVRLMRGTFSMSDPKATSSSYMWPSQAVLLGMAR